MPPHIMFRVFFGLPCQPANDDHPGGGRLAGIARRDDYNGNERNAGRDGASRAGGRHCPAGSQIHGDRLNGDRIDGRYPAEESPGAALPAFLGSRLMLPHAPAEAERPASGPARPAPLLPRHRAHLAVIDGSSG